MVAELGEVQVDVEGFLFGSDDAFLDTTNRGTDIISIGAAGIAVGEANAIQIAGAGNTIENTGEIKSMASAAIAIDENNWIDNGGTIVGYYGGISDNGNDVITNSGRISSTFTPAVNEDAGGNKISNTGLISENSVGAVIVLEDGGNQITNSGTISGNGPGIEIGGDGDNSINNSGKITTIGYSLSLTGNANSVVNSGTLSDGIYVGGQYDIKNDGEILALANTNGVSDDAIAAAGAGAIVNTGKIKSSTIAVSNTDAAAADKSSLINHGLISGGSGGSATPAATATPSTTTARSTRPRPVPMRSTATQRASSRSSTQQP